MTIVYIEDNAWAHVDREYLFERSTQYIARVIAAHL